ncbi:TIGR01244 family sulfur transferase [Caulobacter sp.]|uniref:TIGR01244 family sulfur transferase n=1 Tax=Caulobacter sp. TaxID=78 RepID=UPI003BAA4850
MSDFRRVTDTLSVSPQVTEADMARAAAEGFVLVINNRPDGEDPTQPSSATIEAAARAAGLDYVHVPVRGGPGPDQVDAVRIAIEVAKGPVLAFCRSGTRSIVTWSIGQAISGAADRETLVNQGAAAGYDLSGVLPG